jgi:hypothetical protein
VGWPPAACTHDPPAQLPASVFVCVREAAQRLQQLRHYRDWVWCIKTP